MTLAHNVYEIEFDVLGRHREDYEQWVSAGVVDWISHEAVSDFEVYRNEKGLSPEVKFVFGFESLRKWATFAGSAEHETAIDELTHLSDGLDATLWQQAVIDFE